MIDNTNLLTSLPLMGLEESQLEKFTSDGLHARGVGRFDAGVAYQTLRTRDNHTVVAIDIGGDKLESATFTLKEGVLIPSSHNKNIIPSLGGRGYLALLEELAKTVNAQNIPVGVSFAGPVDGTKIVQGPNVPVFEAELRQKYGGDFKQLFPSLVSLRNDAVAGIIAGSVEVSKTFPQTQQVIYLINGSGLGGAVYKNYYITALEPGHVPVTEDLNKNRQDKPCGFMGNQYVCVESVAASRAGVEDLWLKIKGERLDGRQISQRYVVGDDLARSLYENAAELTAHVIKGIANNYDLLKAPQDTAIVCHGGIFNVPAFGERILQILTKNLGFTPIMMQTNQFSDNACIDGAAVAAINPEN